MKMLCRVCADFQDKRGNVIYRIRPEDRLVYKDDVPEAIRDDLLFRMLVADGSIEVIETVEQRKKLENDPAAGTDAAGKKTEPKTVKAAKAEKKPEAAGGPAEQDQK